MEKYFYYFLEPVSKELARILQELEGAIYSSPRFMLTHSRTLIEALMEKVMIHENMDNEPYLTVIERIQDLDKEELLSQEVEHALHEVRKLGNIAAHDTRQFKFSESLITWEYIYTIVKWFVEVYGSYEIEVPDYVDPEMQVTPSYDLEEMNIRFKKIEKLFKESLRQQETEQISTDEAIEHPEKELAISVELDGEQTATIQPLDVMDEAPGLTPVRTLIYGGQALDIPYFLRDAFLLPQRFLESEKFLIRLGGAEQARIMSELPSNLVGLHEHVSRFNDTHVATFYLELQAFIEEEIRRRKLIKARPGELFLFYEADEIIVTEDLGDVQINTKHFTGMPSLIEQLRKDGIKTVRDLPKELVIIGKYKNVGKTRVASFFQQLKNLQIKGVMSR